jgi:hypothetical protein
MGTSAVAIHALAQSVRFTDSDLIVELIDGRSVSLPLVWFPRLSSATPQQLENFEIRADGEGIHWPDLNENVSVAGLLRGAH